MNKEIEALKSQVVGLENAYERLADKCEKYYKALEIIKDKEWFYDFMKEHLTREWFTKEEYDLLKEVLL